MKAYLLAFSLSLPVCLLAQVENRNHPLSKQDSANIRSHYQKYEFHLGKGDRKEASRWINEIALTYWNHSFYQEAINYYEKSIELNEGVANENGIAMINNNLGMLYSDIEDYETSLECFRKTLAARKVNREKDGMIAALVNMSVVLNNLKRHDEAIGSLDEALIYARELSDADQIKSCYGMLAESYTLKGNNAEAMKYFELYRSFHEYVQQEKIKKVRQKEQEAELRAQLAEAEKQNKELQLKAKQAELFQANEQLEASDSVRTALLRNLTRHQLEVELLKREKKNKELEARLAEQERNLADEKLVNSQKIRNISLIGAFLALVVAVLLFFRYREKRKTSQVLALKNQDILQKSEEISAQSEELKRVNERLVKLNEFKENMTGMIVHDLKNPLSTVIHFTENSPDAKIKAVNQSGKQMLNLVMNILDVQKFEEANIQLHRSPHTLFEVARLASNDVSVLARHKNISITNNLPVDRIFLLDLDLMERVFVNLLSNALKHTASNGKINLHVFQESTGIRVMVTDNGEGIPQEKLEIIFRKFGQANSKNQGLIRSTGLGLTFCKMVIEAHQGTIGVESEPRKGSTFWFTLPVEAETQEAKLVLPETTASFQNPLVLEKETIALLAPFLERIAAFDIYEISEINQVLNEIDSSTDVAISSWKEAVKSAIFASNQEKFHQLTKHLL